MYLTPAQLLANTQYTVSVTTSVSNCTVGAWIDYNQNGVFTDANEKIANYVNLTGSKKTATFTFTVPSNVTDSLQVVFSASC